MKTIVLAYSGGLDTSIIVPWLREKYDARVICVAADIGQGPDELAGVRAKALASGAEECYVEDLRDEFVRDFIFPTLRAGAVYNRKYLLGTRARREVEAARTLLPSSVPIAGMYCMGEVAPTGAERRSHYLNETFVTLLLGS